MREKTRRGRLNEYGNEYGKYAACVLSGVVLYGLSEAVGEIGDPVRDGVLARNEYGGGDRQYELLVEGLENGEDIRPGERITRGIESRPHVLVHMGPAFCADSSERCLPNVYQEKRGNRWGARDYELGGTVNQTPCLPNVYQVNFLKQNSGVFCLNK